MGGSLRSLRQPYDVVSAPVEQPARPTLALAAPVHGSAYALSDSPYALDRLYTHGVGVYQIPRSARLFVPYRCILLHVTPDRSAWVFALNNHLHLRIEIRSAQPLPHVFSQVAMGQVLKQGEHFAQLHHALINPETMVVTTVHQVTVENPEHAVPHYLALSQSGEMRASEDLVLQLYLLDS